MTQKNITTNWSATAGKILAYITAVWFALMVAAILLTVPTKVIFWGIKWFWNLW